MGQRQSQKEINESEVTENYQDLINFYGTVINVSKIVAITREYTYKEINEASPQSGLLIFFNDTTKVFIDINDYKGPVKTLNAMYSKLWSRILKAKLSVTE
jgi:hypothetical protein